MTSIFLVLTYFASVSYAQTVVGRRRRSPSRVIAGIVVGCVCFLVILSFFCLMLARRRRQRSAAVAQGPYYQQQHHSKPLFGGPWTGLGMTTAPAAAHNTGTNGAPFSHKDVANYPAPPPYVTDKNNNGTASQQYPPPPVPPPAVHTNDNDQFVGGFRTS